MSATTTSPTATLAERVDALDWDALRAQLDDRGFASPRRSCARRECDELAALFDDGRFRSTDRHGPPPLRRRPLPLLRPSAPGAHRRAARRASTAASRRSPTTGRRCSAARRTRSRSSTRSCSRAAARPARSARRRSSCATARATGTRCTRTSTATSPSRSRSLTVLSEPGVDFEGGEFVLLEQRPRAQSRAHVAPPAARRVRDLPDAAPAERRQARLPQGRPAPRRQHGHAAAGGPRSGSSSTTPAEPRAPGATGGAVRGRGEAGRRDLRPTLSPSTRPRPRPRGGGR